MGLGGPPAKSAQIVLGVGPSMPPNAQPSGRSGRLRVVPPGKGRGRRPVDPGPGLVSLPAGAHPLPRELTSFVGREEDAVTVADLVAASPLVTVTGPAGMGKTRLALHVAGRLDGEFTEGVRLIELALIPVSEDSDTVAEAVASALDIRVEAGRTYTDVLTARLGTLSVLLVLDNCEHVSLATATLVGQLLSACPGLKFLCTSQQPLGIPGEQVWPLGPLSLPGPGNSGAGSDAVALFHARAKAVNPGFVANSQGADAVAEICRRLDGIPLAIELAAARTAVLSPVEIAEHLDERFSLLARTGLAVTPRHQTLQSALEWSYDLLPSTEKALFRRLSVFAGGAGLNAVREVCVGGEVAPEAIVDLLAALVSKSLVVADTGRSRSRYRLLETIRAFARDRMDEAGESFEIEERHAACFLAVGEKSWHRVLMADQRQGADALEQEHDNLRAALGWLLTDGDPRVALRLASALTPFWKARGHFREGRDWLERAVAAAGTKAASPLRVRALWGLGLLSMLQGDLERATSALEGSLEHARRQNHDRAAMEALNLLAFISIFTSDPRTALPILEESVTMARQQNDAGSVITALFLCGRARLFSGDTEAAEAAFQECREIGHSIGEGDDSDGLIGLGMVAVSRGRHSEAAELFTQVLPMVVEVDEKFDTALVRSFLGELAWRRGDLDEARSQLGEGLALARSMGAPYPMARCLAHLGRLAGAEGEHGSAVRLTEEAIDAARRARFSYALVRCLHARADVERSAGDLDAARAVYEEALAVGTEAGDRVGMAHTLRSLGTLARLRGDYGGAVSMLLDALDLHVATLDVGGVADTLEGLAGVAGVQDRAAHAARLMGAAAGLRKANGSVRSPVDAAGYQADVKVVKAGLKAAEVKEAWAQGAALSFDEAVALGNRSRGGRKRPTVGWEALTSTERQVVDLVVTGLSNAEIAERMFVSPRTVQGHLSRAFSKIGVSSRRELRDEVRRQDG